MWWWQLHLLEGFPLYSFGSHLSCRLWCWDNSWVNFSSCASFRLPSDSGRSPLLTLRLTAYLYQHLDTGTLAQKPVCMLESLRNFLELPYCYVIFNFKSFLNTARVWELLIYTIHCARFKTWTQNYFMYLLSRDGDRTLPWNLGFMRNWWIDFKARVILCQFPVPVLNTGNFYFLPVSWDFILGAQLPYYEEAQVTRMEAHMEQNWECEWATLESAPAAPSRHTLALIT